MIRLLLFLLLMPAAFAASAQTDTARQLPGIFERITRHMQAFRPDTTPPPRDRTTRRITEILRLKGGFDISEAIEFKLEEDRRNQSMPDSSLRKLASFFREGNGRRWLHHALVHIYRKHFTPKEIRQLLKFYQTAAGRKMAADFPLIMLESLAVADGLKKSVTGE
ncbi:MAG TPA: DUF2059 domain-containing protein [Chitinophagaceae bacterium]|jgi:hypothetical protein|nr:DUF2059 domain-containing protein [Chitinophagaceae bacterium]